MVFSRLVVVNSRIIAVQGRSMAAWTVNNSLDPFSFILHPVFIGVQILLYPMSLSASHPWIKPKIRKPKSREKGKKKKVEDLISETVICISNKRY